MTRDDAGAIWRLHQTCWRVGYSIQGRDTIKSADKRLEDVPTRGIVLLIFDIENYALETVRLRADGDGFALESQNVFIKFSKARLPVFSSSSTKPSDLISSKFLKRLQITSAV